MKRKEFLGMFGTGAAAAACVYCLGGCSSPTDSGSAPPPPKGFSMTVDLSQSANSALNTDGGYIYRDNIIIARTNGGAYVAVSSACTHQGTTIVFDKTNNNFFCPGHGSRFATDGSVVNGPASSPLTRYTTHVSGSTLTVTA